MTDTKKRILPWKEDKDEMRWNASALTGGYVIICWVRGTFTAFRSVNAGDAHLGVPEHKTLESAMDACEADYVARCTEFLRVAGDGECVVSVNLLRDARGMIRDSGCKCHVCEGVCTNLTAAIDAAGGGK